jgi:pimeloyl-ACP methyl ester carboxylesterase
MPIAIRASRRHPLLGLVLLGTVLFVTLSSRPTRADLVYFKDGFALEGKIKREMTLEFDQVGREAYHMPKGFFYVDDGPRRIFFSPSQVRYPLRKEPAGEDQVVYPDGRPQINPKKLPDFLEVVKAPEWDDKWSRRFQFRSPNGPVNVPQHISQLTPYWARVDSRGNYFWACAYLTRELGPETVQRLLATHKDFQETRSMSSTQRASLRLRKADFYSQAGWFDLAETELNQALRDVPDQKERIEAARKMLLKLSTREQLEEIKCRHLAGQHRRVRQMLVDFPSKGDADKKALEQLREHDDAYKKILSELEELKADYENTDRLLKESGRLLDKVRRDGSVKRVLAQAGAEIVHELNFENVGRLDAFLGQARQAERFQKKGKKSDLDAEQLLSLAVSGWLLGSASAETSPETALRLWRGREMVRKYLRTEDGDERRNMLRVHQRGSRTESASMDELIQIIRTLPPVEADKELPEGIIERKTERASYLLQLPPEYRHGRAYPLLIVLHHGSESPRDTLNLWSRAAAKNGYILVAPEWQDGGLNSAYSYSEREHLTVLNALRDVRRHFNADEDRVFLTGQGDGGAMAFDVGLGHPDLFAGVLPMGAGPEYHAKICWRNGQYLPFYVVHGNKGPNGKEMRSLFELWVRRNFPMLWIDYKGRGAEWFGGEVPLMFDWMRDKKRPFPLNRLGTSGQGSSFGNEFCTMRSCDNHFYWLSTNDVRRIHSIERWRNVQPAALTAVIYREDNRIVAETQGLGQVTIWLGRNRKGEDMIDFDRELTVIVDRQTRWARRKISPSLEVLLEDLYQRGDRQQLFLAKISIQLLGRAKGR